MSSAQQFGDRMEIISNLKPATVYRLAAPKTPDDLRQSILQELSSADKPDDASILQTIKQAAAREKSRKAEEEALALLDPKVRKKKHTQKMLEKARIALVADEARVKARQDEQNRELALQAISEILVARIPDIDVLIAHFEAAGIQSLAESLKGRLEQSA
jgi:hypothetical protein